MSADAIADSAWAAGTGALLVCHCNSAVLKVATVPPLPRWLATAGRPWRGRHSRWGSDAAYEASPCSMLKAEMDGDRGRTERAGTLAALAHGCDLPPGAVSSERGPGRAAEQKTSCTLGYVMLIFAFSGRSRIVHTRSTSLPLPPAAQPSPPPPPPTPRFH